MVLIKKIFASANADLIAANIHKQLTQLREYRFASVNTVEEFTLAIRCAHILYQYRLELKHAQEPTAKTQIISLFSIFPIIDNPRNEKQESKELSMKP